jgi:CheY-like chemotaxis protein
MLNENPVVLLVDDNASYEVLMRTVFQRAGYAQPLQFAAGGDQAAAYLRGEDRYRDRLQFPMPTVVLMDLNMPGRNGFEMLEWIRKEPALKRLCVYILSSSSRPEDVERAYDLGANAYLVKPGNLDGMVRMAESLMVWLKISHFAPPNIGEGARWPAPVNGFHSNNTATGRPALGSRRPA